MIVERRDDDQLATACSEKGVAESQVQLLESLETVRSEARRDDRHAVAMRGELSHAFKTTISGGTSVADSAFAKRSNETILIGRLVTSGLSTAMPLESPWPEKCTIRGR